MTPARYLPGIGLRPGGERQDIEPLVPILYSAMYESIAAHSRLGLWSSTFGIPTTRCIVSQLNIAVLCIVSVNFKQNSISHKQKT